MVCYIIGIHYHFKTTTFRKEDRVFELTKMHTAFLVWSDIFYVQPTACIAQTELPPPSSSPPGECWHRDQEAGGSHCLWCHLTSLPCTPLPEEERQKEGSVAAVGEGWI